jgi:calcium-binding protein CML
VKLILDHFDENGDGQISYTEFLGAVAPYRPGDAQVYKLAEKLRRVIRKRAHSRGGDFRDPFRHFDADDRSYFTYAEFRDGLSVLPDFQDLTRDCLKSLFQQMDLNGDRKVTFNEFVVFVGDPTYIDVEDRIRYLLVRLAGKDFKHADFGRVFEKLDRRGTGEISPEDFRAALRGVGLRLSESEIKRVVSRFDVNGDGCVSYSEFLEFCEEQFQRSKGVTPLLTQVRNAISLESGRSAESLRDLFRRFDRDNSGYIDRTEFKAALKELGFEMSRRETDALFLCFDFRGHESLSYEAFVDAVEGQGSGYEDAAIIEIRRLIADANINGVDLKQSFYHFDKNRDGQISHREFVEGLRRVGIRLKDASANKLISNFGNGGKMNFEEFCDMVFPPSTPEHVRSYRNSSSR